MNREQEELWAQDVLRSFLPKGSKVIEHKIYGKQMTDFNTLVNTDKIKADVDAAQVQEAKKVEQTPAPVVEPVVI